MKRIKYIILLSMVVLCLSKTAYVRGEKTTMPHVLLIYTDDHRYTGVHAVGKQQVKTPHMDRLAHEGISFSNAYLMGSFSGATCIPSRAMLHTGRNLFELEGVGYTIPTNHTMIGETFMKAGYYAHFVGKWHQDLKSLARSFHTGGKVCGKPRYLVDQFRMPFSDWQADGNYQQENCYLLQYDEDGNVFRRPLTKDDKRGPIGTEKTGPHVSEVLADEAVGFTQDYKKDQPFFMYLAFPTPHDPRQAPQKYKDMYPVEDIQLPPSYMAQHPFDNGHMVLRDEKLAAWPRTPEIAKKELADYYSIITHLDDQIGRVVAALKENGLYEKTLIVFAGDSGLAVGNHGLLGKQSVYDEDGLHVPFIISGGMTPVKAKEIDAFCYIHDIFPTICDLVGITAPRTVSGLSLKPVIDGKKEQVRDYTYHAYRQFQRAYRKGDYKLIEYVHAEDADREGNEFEAGSRVTQLFNIKSDPWETQDLSFFPEYKELLATLQKEMKEKALELEDRKESVNEKYDFWDYY